MWVFGRGRIELFFVVLGFFKFFIYFLRQNSLITHLDKNILKSVWLFYRFWEEPPMLHKSRIRQHDRKPFRKPFFGFFLWPENISSCTLKRTNSTLKSKRKLDFQIIKTKWLLQIHIINSGVTIISREPVPHDIDSCIYQAQITLSLKTKEKSLSSINSPTSTKVHCSTIFFKGIIYQNSL